MGCYLRPSSDIISLVCSSQGQIACPHDKQRRGRRAPYRREPSSAQLRGSRRAASERIAAKRPRYFTRRVCKMRRALV